MPIEVNTEALGEILRAASEFREISQGQYVAPRSKEDWEKLDTSIWMISRELDKEK